MPEGEADNPVYRLDGLVARRTQFSLTEADFAVGVEEHRHIERFLVAPVMVE